MTSMWNVTCFLSNYLIVKWSPNILLYNYLFVILTMILNKLLLTADVAKAKVIDGSSWILLTFQLRTTFIDGSLEYNNN